MNGNELILLRRIEELENYIERVPEVGGVWQDWTPTLSLLGTGTIPTYSSISAKYTIIGKFCSALVSFSNTTGGTAGSGYVALACSYPITPAVDSFLGSGSVYDAGLGTIHTVSLRYYSNSVFYFQRYSGANVLASEQSNASRYITFNMMYAI